MTIFVQDIITRAVDTLQDAGSVRWPAAELIRYVNDGVRALVITRPDTSVKKVSLTPVAGARQSMPDDAVSLVDIIGNTSGRQRSVSRVDMTALSMVDPEWQNATASATPSHFMFDERDPYFYYLYRPSTGTGSIDMLCSGLLRYSITCFPVRMTRTLSSAATPRSVPCIWLVLTRTWMCRPGRLRQPPQVRNLYLGGSHGWFFKRGG